MELDEIQKSLQIQLQKHMKALDEKKIRGLLADCLPEKKLERNLLQTLFVEGITQDVELIKKNSNNRFYHYVKCMVDDYGIQKDKAAWGVMTWCYLLGCDTSLFSEANVMLDKQTIDQSEKESITRIHIHKSENTLRESGDSFCFYFNKQEAHNTVELQQVFAECPEEAIKYLKRGLISDFFKQTRPDISNVALDAMDDIAAGLNEWKAFQRFLLSLANEEGGKSFIWKGITCKDTGRIYRLFSRLVSQSGYDKTENYLLINEILLEKAISWYLDMIGSESELIKSLEDEYIKGGIDNKRLVLHRIAMLDPLYEKDSRKAFKDLDRLINTKIDLSEFTEDSFFGHYTKGYNDSFYRFLSLYLFDNEIINSPIIDADENSKQMLISMYLSKQCKKKGKWIPPKAFKYRLIKYKPVKYYNEIIAVKQFVNYKNPNMTFCPIHNCRLGLIEVTKPVDQTITSFETLHLKYCPECKEFITDSKGITKSERGIAYKKDERIIPKELQYTFKCRGCGKQVSYEKGLLEDFKSQGLQQPTRCKKCEEKYQKLKSLYPVSEHGLF